MTPSTRDRNEPSLIDRLKSIGFGTYLMIGITLISCFLTLGPIFAFEPQKAILRFQIWRFLTFEFASLGVFEFIFSILFWIFWGNFIERKVGSIQFIFRVVAISLMVAIAETAFFLILCLFFNSDSTGIHASGNFKPLFIEITVFCVQNGNAEAQLMGLPYKIRNVHIPVIIFLISIVLTGSLTVVPSLAMSLLITLIFDLELLQLDDQFVSKIENKVKCFSEFCTLYKAEDPSSKWRGNNNNETLIGGHQKGSETQKSEWQQRFGN